MLSLLLASTLVFAEAKIEEPFSLGCSTGEAANEYEDWEFIANNAVRTADDYAMARFPQATFINGKVEANYQLGGEFEGKYLVMILSQSPQGTAFAVLKPNFNVISAPIRLT